VQSQKPSPQERKSQSYLCCRGYVHQLQASEIAAQINASQSSINRHISISTVQRRLCESGLQGQISAKKALQNDTNNKKRLAWAKKHKQWTGRNLYFGLMSLNVLFCFQPLCLCEMQNRWTVDLRMCSSHREVWRRRCDGVGVLCWLHCQWFI
jgi:hypothetical protein